MAVVLLPFLGTIATALRIPMLAAFLGGFFTSIMDFFVKRFSRVVAHNLTIVTSVILVTGVFIAAINLLILSIQFTLPEGLACGVGLILPSNAINCVSMVFSAKVIRWVYEWKITFVRDHIHLL